MVKFASAQLISMLEEPNQMSATLGLIPEAIHKYSQVSYRNKEGRILSYKNNHLKWRMFGTIHR